MHHLPRNSISLLICLLTTLYAFDLKAQKKEPPFESGAQIWIEPGQTPEQIDGWFALLKQNHMTVTRLFIMWNFLEQPDGSYDWNLYDACFKSGEKHGVGIVATLMPNHGPPHRGYVYKVQDGAIAKTQTALDAGNACIEKVVNRYKTSPALNAWMLMNEPGQMPSEDSLAMARFRLEMRAKYEGIASLNQVWMSNFSSFEAITYSANWSGGGWTWPTSYMDWQTFWRGHLSWYLSGVAGEIRKHDNVHDIHVNPHALLDIPHRYELPKWMNFLSSLGSSIHPVWHFGLLKREEYSMGVSYVCDFVRTAAGAKDFWVTELQGGHNIYTADKPIIPTNDEIDAWMWNSIGSGAKKVIYWCLNPRSQGTEAAEWTMLDWQNKPTARYVRAGAVTAKAQELVGLLAAAKPASPAVTILLSPESRFHQERGAPASSPILSRSKAAHEMAILGWYKAATALGLPIEVRYLDDLLKTPAKNNLMILAHATAVTDAQINELNGLVTAGAKLLISDLSGIYDPYEKSRQLSNGIWQNLCGATLLEILPTDEPGKIKPGAGNPSLPYSTYSGRLATTSASANLIMDNGAPVASRHRLGKGQVLWLPSTVGIAAYEGNEQPLANWLSNVLAEMKIEPTFRFITPSMGIQARLMTGKEGNLLVLTNRSNKPAVADISIAGYSAIWNATSLAKNKIGSPQIAAGKTVVLRTLAPK